MEEPAQPPVEGLIEAFDLTAPMEEGSSAFTQLDINALRQLGSRINEHAFLNHSQSLVSASALFYSLAKFLEKTHIRQNPSWPGYRDSLLEKMRKAAGLAKAKDEAGLGAALEEMLSQCDEISELLGRFHVSTVEKARVKIAADFYARGASLGSASGLAGADKQSVLSYIGVTRIVDKYETIPVQSRLKSAEALIN